MVNTSAIALRYQRWAFGQHTPLAITRLALVRYTQLGLGYCWAQLLPHALRLDTAHILGPVAAADSVLALWVHWHKYANVTAL
jgi:hypothetical protein